MIGREFIHHLNSKETCINEFGSVLVNIDNFANKMEVVFNRVVHRLAHHAFVSSRS